MEGISVRISFEALPNTRDLGGMRTRGGVIAPGKLIRSGALSQASAADIGKLGRLADTVIDLRSAAERAQKPDPDIPGAAYAGLPLIDDLVADERRHAAGGSRLGEVLRRGADSAPRLRAREGGVRREHDAFR